MGKVMQIQVGGVIVKLIEDGDRICGHINKGNTFEPESLAVWAELCRKAPKGSYVIDVGGYTGLFSIAAALMGCKVICIEPMPLNVARIIENCRLNDVTIEIHQAVASSDVGKTELTYNPNVKGMTSGASLIRKKGFKLQVKSITIDSLNVDPVAIKIDVERGEPLVLAGSRKTIKRSKPSLLVEVLDDERSNLVKSSISNYKIKNIIDQRNWLMLPC